MSAAPEEDTTAPATEEADLRRVAEREDALYDALAASDVTAFEDLFAEDCTYIHSTGIGETKQENILGQGHGVHQHGRTRAVSGATRILGDVAVTRGLIDMRDTAHEEPFTIRLRQTLIWVRETGDWRLLLRQATRIPVV